jgi:hypothetical protein
MSPTLQLENGKIYRVQIRGQKRVTRRIFKWEAGRAGTWHPLLRFHQPPSRCGGEGDMGRGVQIPNFYRFAYAGERGFRSAFRSTYVRGGRMNGAEAKNDSPPPNAAADEPGAKPLVAKFEAIWGNSFHNPGKMRVTLEFFGDDSGYDDEDRAGLAALQAGETWTSKESADHTVKRLS